MSERKQLINSQ